MIIEWIERSEQHVFHISCVNIMGEREVAKERGI
jgi:hypothetical protein